VEEDVKISFVKPRPALRPYIESFWALESPIGLPASATSVAAPNGCSKLIIPYENSIVSVANGRTQMSYAHRMYFVGNRDTATLIRSSAQKTGFIAIEFRPHGAFPIFGLPMSETFNQLWETDCVFGQWSRDVQVTLNDLERVDKKIAYIQDRLILLLRKNRCDAGLVRFDASGVNHGFVRTKHGAVTTFDVPGAGTGSGQGTVPMCNNPAGAITGFCIDANGVLHGLLRTP
jgi:hypothetical protein